MPLSLVGASAAALSCLVIHVADGDSVTARCETATGPSNLRIRLAEIDAPEQGQPFGDRSKQSLARLCGRQTAVIVPRTTDRYGRTVAALSCGGQDPGQAPGAGWAGVGIRSLCERSQSLRPARCSAARRAPACGSTRSRRHPGSGGLGIARRLPCPCRRRNDLERDASEQSHL